MQGDDEHSETLFPEGAFDVTGQQLDLRKTNRCQTNASFFASDVFLCSWLLLLDQVDPSELVAVFAVNALAPFIINRFHIFSFEISLLFSIVAYDV
jgi:hypothetical protein